MKYPDESTSVQICYNCGLSEFSSLLIRMLLMSNLRGKFVIPPVQWYFTGIHHTRFCFKQLGSNSRLFSAYTSSRNSFGIQSFVVSIWQSSGIDILDTNGSH